MNTRKINVRVLIVMITLAVVISLIGVVILYFAIPRLKMEKYLNTIETNSKASVSFIGIRENLYVGNDTVFSKRVKRYFGDKLEDICEIICIHSGNVYFLADICDDGAEQKALCCYALNTAEITELYTCDRLSISEVKTSSQLFADQISEQMTYYHNDTIVFNYGNIVTVYSISEKIITEYDSDGYTHPEPTLDFEISSDTVTFYHDGITKSLRISDVMNSNEYLSTLFSEFQNERTATGLSYFDDFFAKVQIIDDLPYIICSVYNRIGESYALFFSYDYDTNTCEYIAYFFTNDIVSSHAYLIYDNTFVKANIKNNVPPQAECGDGTLKVEVKNE